METPTFDNRAMYYLARKNTEFLTINLNGEVCLMFARDKASMKSFLKRRGLTDYELYETYAPLIPIVATRNNLAGACALQDKKTDNVDIFPLAYLKQQPVDFLDYLFDRNKTLYTVQFQKNDKKYFIANDANEAIYFPTLWTARKYAKELEHKHCKVVAVNPNAFIAHIKRTQGLVIVSNDKIMLYRCTAWQAERIARNHIKEK